MRKFIVTIVLVMCGYVSGMLATHVAVWQSCIPMILAGLSGSFLIEWSLDLGKLKSLMGNYDELASKHSSLVDHSWKVMVENAELKSKERLQ